MTLRQATKQGWYLGMGKQDMGTVKQEKGFILATVLVLAAALTVIGIALISSASSQYRLAYNSVYTQNAMLSAEAGIEQSVSALNEDDTFAGYSTPQSFFSNSSQGTGRFTTTVTDSASDSNAKIVTSTGTVYRNGDLSKPLGTRKVKVTVVGTGSPGYSVSTGPGGLILGGSANITNSEVYVNGTLSMSGAARIGSDSVPSTVHVANIACPTGNNPGPTFPTLCTSTQPINIPDWSSVAIIGTVCATGQTQSKFPNTSNNHNQPQIRAGTDGGSGLVVGCTAPTVSPPTYDRAAQVSAVSTTAAGTSNSYVCNSSPFNRTWPSNLRLTGNVTIGTSCNVTVNGNVHITGNLTINGAAKMTVSPTAGTTRPVIIVDGTITVGGSASLLANSVGTGMRFISFKSSASCNPNCTNLTGNDLKNSQGVQTVGIGGGVSLPGMIFHAYWGKITIAGSGNVGSAIGQTVDMSGAGTVVFGTSLGSGQKTWTITSYQQVFN